MADYREKIGQYQPRAYTEPAEIDAAADPVVQYMDKEALKKAIEKNKKAMEKAASELDFKEAARLRDEMYELQEMLDKQS
jgi:excinuclease ABC subunit B